jgi:hypothetical protein
MKYLPALVIVFIALVSIVLLAIAIEAHSKSQQALFSRMNEAKIISSSGETGATGFITLSIASGDSQAVIAVLDNDIDHDGNYDGITDPLAVLGLILGMLSIVFVLRPLIGGRLLLILCDPPKLSSIWPLVLERPG